jgi:hypothetical protein
MIKLLRPWRNLAQIRDPSPLKSLLCDECEQEVLVGGLLFLLKKFKINTSSLSGY